MTRLWDPTITHEQALDRLLDAFPGAKVIGTPLRRVRRAIARAQHGVDRYLKHPRDSPGWSPHGDLGVLLTDSPVLPAAYAQVHHWDD